jgi:hypothetical protein
MIPSLSKIETLYPKQNFIEALEIVYLKITGI